MNRILISALATGVAAAVPLQAQAQEDSPFTGFRLEVLGGYDTVRNGSSVDIDGDAADDIDQSIDGFLYGIGAGYDFDLGTAVLGVEGELSDSTGEEDPGQALNAPFDYRANVGRDLYVGARVGFKVSPQTVLYAKGGYTNTKMNAVVTDNDPADPEDYAVSAHETIDGYRIGAGIEYALPGDTIGFGSGAFAKLEYRYSNYDDLSLNNEGFFTGDNVVGIDLDRHQVVAGVGVRF